jgi:transposase
VQHAWDRHDRLSAIAALSVAPWEARVSLYFQLFTHNVGSEDMVCFIRHLRRHIRRRLILVWDRWSVHRKAARVLQLQGCDWLEFEWLPSYAPELDPVEYIWNHSKLSDLANFVPDDLDDLYQAVSESLEHQSHDNYLKHSFFHAAKLSI